MAEVDKKRTAAIQCYCKTRFGRELSNAEVEMVEKALLVPVGRGSRGAPAGVYQLLARERKKMSR